jgi:hypothetical protein
MTALDASAWGSREVAKAFEPAARAMVEDLAKKQRERRERSLLWAARTAFGLEPEVKPWWA